MEQLVLFSSNPNPRIRIPEVKMNNQESTKIRRIHIRGQERSFNKELPRNIVRREMRCARMVTPRKWTVALRTCIPTFGKIIELDRSMAVSTPRSGGTDTGREKLGVFSSPRAAFYRLTFHEISMTGTVGRVCSASRAKIRMSNWRNVAIVRNCARRVTNPESKVVFPSDLRSQRGRGESS